MNRTYLAAGLSLLMIACTPKPAATAPDVARAPAPEIARITAASEIAAGAYLTEIGGCHDCHTAGWPQAGGHAPVEKYLAGVPVGFSGPWGTSYAGNLRLLAQTMTGEEWADMMQHRSGLPPMPWFAVNRMSREDLTAIHAYLVSLGPAGEPVPAPVPPGEAPTTPYIWFDAVAPETHPANG